eukprot:384137-Rhodomonas_salina.1
MTLGMTEEEVEAECSRGPCKVSASQPACRAGRVCGSSLEGGVWIDVVRRRRRAGHWVGNRLDVSGTL